MMLHTLVLTVLVVGAVHAKDYCSICPDHTMCLYSGKGSKCSNLLASGLSEAGKDEIIDKHNELRNKVALGQETQGTNGGEPPAANMMTVSWDSELATVAQRWADQCDYGHDKCRNVKRFKVGQNIHESHSSCNKGDTKLDYSAAVQSWYNEVSKFDKDVIDPFVFSMDTGHYTQVVWADTVKIGCGYTSYNDGRRCNNYLVCNYGPAGNMRGAAMYKKGSARSACPDSPLDSRYPGLCGETTQS